MINVRIKSETAASVISHNTSLHQLIPTDIPVPPPHAKGKKATFHVTRLYQNLGLAVFIGNDFLDGVVNDIEELQDSLYLINCKLQCILPKT